MHRGAGRDRIGLAAGGLDLGQGVLPALADADVEIVVGDAAVGAHQACHQDVADAIVDRVLVRHPAFLHQPALEAELGGDGGDHAGVVGLHAADGDQRVGVRRDDVGHQVLHLAELVAAHGETGIAVVALGPDFDLAAERLGQARQELDRGRPEGERIAFEFGEVHGGPPKSVIEEAGR